MLILSHYYKTLFFSLTVLLLISCNAEEISEGGNMTDPENPEETAELIPETELFERLDILDINQQISAAAELLEPTDIMKKYYPAQAESGEGNESIKIRENSLEHQEMEVILIHDGLLDDSVKGLKYVMVLKQQDEKWKVVSLKKNWKCYKGRGHSFWGIDACS